GCALVGAVVLALGSAPATAGTKVKLTQPVDSLTFFPIYVGRQRGYFKAEGIDLEVISTSGGGPHLQAVIAGQAQFTASPGTYQINALKQGKRVIGVYNILKRNIIGVVIHKESAARIGVTEKTPFGEKIKRIKGLTLGVTRPGALTFILAEYLVGKAGLDPRKDVRILGVGGGATIVPALRNRKVDAIFISTPHPERAISEGYGMWFVNNAAGEDPDMDEFMMSILMVTPEFAEKNAQMVRKTVRAMKRSVRWILGHSVEDSYRAVKPFFGKKVKAAALMESVRTVKAAVSEDGNLSEKAVRTTMDLMVRAGKIKKPFSRADVFTDRFLN
ncbi:MAG: ABC transporter substrate-binding protein, partial [Nitrospinota bacterium]